MLCISFFDTYKSPERFLVVLNFVGSQMITPRKFSCSRAKQQYGTGKRQLMMRWKWYFLRCFLIWCLGSKECSYSLENTPSNDIPYTIFVFRVAQVMRRHEGPSPKSLISNKNFKPQHTLICRDIKICCDLRTFTFCRNMLDCSIWFVFLCNWSGEKCMCPYQRLGQKCLFKIHSKIWKKEGVLLFSLREGDWDRSSFLEIKSTNEELWLKLLVADID